MKSPSHAILWETWRVTRAEAAWKLAFAVIGGLAALALSATVAPSDNPKQYEDIKDNGAAIAMILIILPHLVGWQTLAKLNGGRPGFPLVLNYTRPVGTAVVVGLPMAYLTAMSTGVYLVSALILRAISGYSFPLFALAAWIAALTLIGLAASWSTRSRTIQLLAMLYAITKVFGLVMQRLTAVEIPGGYDWPPRLWPALFDFPLTDYLWIGGIGLASFGVAVFFVAGQRHGGRATVPLALRDGLWDRLVNLVRFRCPTLSATRAQVWLDLKSSGLPALAIGVTLAIVALLAAAVAGAYDAALNADVNKSVRCLMGGCFYARPMVVIFAMFSPLAVLFLAGNAFGVRRGRGRAYLSPFEATQAFGTAQLAALKLLVRSACILAAFIALGVSAWMSLPLLGDAVFIQMWNISPSSQLRAIESVVAALSTYEQFALAVVAAIGVAIWVAGFAVLEALWTRYSRRANIAASSLLLFGLALALLALSQRNGIVAQWVADAIFSAARSILLAGMLLTSIYISWKGFAERVLTVRYAIAAAAISAAFAAAWVTVLRVVDVRLAPMSAVNAVSMVSPALLPLILSVLAPWSLSRVRHI
jgi:hypothetical protein